MRFRPFTCVRFLLLKMLVIWRTAAFNWEILKWESTLQTFPFRRCFLINSIRSILCIFICCFNNAFHNHRFFLIAINNVVMLFSICKWVFWMLLLCLRFVKFWLDSFLGWPYLLILKYILMILYRYLIQLTVFTEHRLWIFHIGNLVAFQHSIFILSLFLRVKFEVFGGSQLLVWIELTCRLTLKCHTIVIGMG